MRMVENGRVSAGVSLRVTGVEPRVTLYVAFPRLIEGLFGEHYRRITETAHALGLKTVMHSCGNTTPLLERFVSWGFDAVHPMEPTAGVDLATAKKAVGDRLCLIENLDITHILVDTTREEVFAAVRQAIGDASAGGGFILVPDHSHPDISVQRLRWMVEAAHTYCTYTGQGL